MAVELDDALSTATTLVASGGGVFEVSVDGDLLFSKRETGRFPEDGEVLRLIRDR